MRDWLKRIFKKSLPVEAPLPEELLSVLSNAVSDVGYWSWWTQAPSGDFQIEFGGTQLYFPPLEETAPPNSQVAFAFAAPTAINFISRGSAPADFDWAAQLQEDKIEPLNCSPEAFSFGKNAITQSLLEEVTDYKTVLGTNPMDSYKASDAVFLAFWCGDVGFSIAAAALSLTSHAGDFPLSEVMPINRTWWEYWKHYWEVRGTENQLPEDYGCEVTIPIDKFSGFSNL